MKIKEIKDNNYTYNDKLKDELLRKMWNLYSTVENSYDQAIDKSVMNSPNNKFHSKNLNYSQNTQHTSKTITNTKSLNYSDYRDLWRWIRTLVKNREFVENEYNLLLDEHPYISYIDFLMSQFQVNFDDLKQIINNKLSKGCR